MVDELEQFQQDLLESVRQMKAGEAARATHVPLSRAEDRVSKNQGLMSWEVECPIDSASLAP